MYQEQMFLTKEGYKKFSDPYIQDKIKELNEISDRYLEENGKLTTQFYIDQFPILNEKYNDREFTLTLIRSEYGMSREDVEGSQLEYDDELWEKFQLYEHRNQELLNFYENYNKRNKIKNEETQEPNSTGNLFLTKEGYKKFDDPYIQTIVKDFYDQCEVCQEENGEVTTMFFIDSFGTLYEKYNDRELIFTLINCFYFVFTFDRIIDLEDNEDLWEGFLKKEELYRKLSDILDTPYDSKNPD